MTQFYNLHLGIDLLDVLSSLELSSDDWADLLVFCISLHLLAVSWEKYTPQLHTSLNKTHSASSYFELHRSASNASWNLFPPSICLAITWRLPCHCSLEPCKPSSNLDNSQSSTTWSSSMNRHVTCCDVNHNPIPVTQHTLHKLLLWLV